MFETATHAALEHAKSVFPHESIGVVIGGAYYPLENTHEKPEDAFYVADKIYTALVREKGSIEAVIHSHPHKGEVVPRLFPSKQDMQQQAAFAVPWGIICCDSESAWPVQWFGDQCPIPVLEGRGFIHGVQDCYSLIRDYYRLHHNLTIKDYPREWEWWVKSDDDLYSTFFKDAGFVEVPLADIQKGDGILMPLGFAAIRHNVVSHGAIYLGDEMLLHHKSGDAAYDPTRLSCVENMHRYRKYFRHVLRHESLM